MDRVKEVEEILLKEYQKQGFVEENDILDKAIEFDLSLDSIEYLCGKLLTKKALIKTKEEDKEYRDWSQIDYQKVYNSVIEIDSGLKVFVEEVKEIKPPQYGECDNLILNARNGNNYAIARIFEMHIRAVVRIALGYHIKQEYPLAEAIQDGCMGLLKAIEKYDHTREEKFISYASLWIRQYILRYGHLYNPLIYYPVHILDKIKAVLQIKNKRLYISTEEETTQIIEDFKITKTELEELQKFMYKIYSTEELIYNESEILGDDLLCLDNLNEKILNHSVYKMMKQILSTLSEREEKVLILRYGLGDDKEKTLEEVGNIMGVTRERIRQIEKKAFTKIKHPTRLNKIKKLF